MLVISVLLNLVLVGFVVYNHRERKRTYKILNDVKKSMSDKNKEITDQATQLLEANEKLLKFNQRLEDDVIVRTEEATLQYRNMVESIHFCAHKLRGTLASMVGLLQLGEKENMSMDAKELFELMNVCVRQLDEIVHELVQGVDGNKQIGDK